MTGETSLGDVLSGGAAEPVTEEIQQPAAETGVDESVTPTDEQQQTQEQQEDPIERHRKGLEAGIAAERTKRQAIERERDEMRARLQQFEQQQRKAVEPAKAAEAEPAREDFASDADYFKALVKHEAKQLREAEKAEEAQERAYREAQEQAQQMQRTADEVVTKGQQAFPDFDTVINSGIGPLISQETQHAHLFRTALLTGKRAHEVAYFLGKNPDEAQRIFSMPPLQMVDELAEIRLTKLDVLTQAQAQTKPVIPKTLTQARDARGQFTDKAYDGPTPLDAILAPTKR